MTKFCPLIKKKCLKEKCAFWTDWENAVDKCAIEEIARKR